MQEHVAYARADTVTVVVGVGVKACGVCVVVFVVV